MDRVRRTKLILWSILGLAASVGITRFLMGIGAVTNLTDKTPWGLWIGFDVVSGVALAAGGFVITAVVYVLGKEEFHPIVKPAVLTAFLGYIAVVAGLMFDLGLPWNIWHMIIFWQHHSPLFEVGWCVMLYTTVLLLEFSPVPLEEASRYARIRTFLMKYRLVLVMLGIMLSTLHQSSLGSLFLIMPHRLHELWYTPVMPIIFFISAIGLGLMMVCLESLITSYLYRRETELKLLSKLGKAAIWVLGLYFLVRMGDIIVHGKFGLIFDGTWESILFILEMSIAIIIPVILLSIPKIRNSQAGMWTCSWMVVFGFVFNRINTSGVSMIGNVESYFPSWMEVAVSAGVVSAAMLAFMFAVEHFRVWECKACDEENPTHERAHFDRSSEVWLGEPGYCGRIKYSLTFVVAAAIGFALIPSDRVNSEGREPIQVREPSGYKDMMIDGDRDLNTVDFPHFTHMEKNGKDESCSKCHHMNLPMDSESGCSDCHRNMFEPADAFKHDWHSSPNGADLACDKCHAEGVHRTAESAVKCQECHKDLYPEGVTIEVSSYMAPGYVDAMHGLCIGCHRAEDAKSDTVKLGLCKTCHMYQLAGESITGYEEYYNNTEQNWISLPGE